MSDAPLAPYRVLDLTDERGLLCGQILADLGADVIQIEPPGGSRARRLGPFAGGRRDPESSLWWWAYARNKRSIVLDLESEEGRASLRDLVATADFLIESEAPGRLAALGLGPDDLLAANPRLVYVSISPFGQDGPKRDWAASDMTVFAAAGPLVLTGDADRAPLRLGAVPQAFHHAAADAAVAALAAHHERARSGRGQYVDVAAVTSAMIATQFYALATLMRSPDGTRISGGLKVGTLRVPLVWPAKDGYVSFAFLFGTALGPFSRRFMEYLCEQGVCDEAMRDKDWIGYFQLLLSGAEPIEEWERVERTITEFTSSRTKEELLALTIERGFLFAPITTMSDVVASPQLAAREYFREGRAPDGRTFRHPGPFVRLGRSPLRQERPPPRIGEHQVEVMSEARERRVPAASATSAGGEPPLAGIKVLDFMWVMAGPAATRMLADLGATVVRVESPTRADAARTVHPFYDNKPDADGTALFGNCNAGKLGVALDLSRPEGREVVLDLVRWADVVTESFSPKAMRNWGLGYDKLREVNPRVIMVSSSLNGQTGPLSKMAGFGTMGAALGGFHHLTSWPDRPPAGVFAAYTDYVAPRFTASAILAALEHRRRTGEGQFVDQSQIEASLHFLAPAILDYTVNGHVAGPMGNDDAHLAPHGVYPSAGDDLWIAVACRSDEEWRALCGVIGRDDLAADARLATAEGRLAHRRELDEAISAWTCALAPREAEDRLQKAGVAAHGVQNGRELATDPQIAHRGHFVDVPHATLGSVVVEGPRARLSRTPARVTRGAPTLGEHTSHVLEQILGYDEERITTLVAAGVLG